MVSHWSLSDSKFPQVFRTLLSIDRSLVWMVSTRPLISKPSSIITIILLFLLLFFSLGVFHNSFNWWYFTGILTIASLQISLSLLSIQPDFSNFRFLTFQRLQLRLISLLTSCSTTFSSSLARSKDLSSFSPFFTFILWSAGITSSFFLVVKT